MAANNGSTATDNSSRVADSGNSTTTSNDNANNSTNRSDGSSASGAQVAANNGGTATDSRNQSTTDNSNRSTTNTTQDNSSATNGGRGSVANGGGNASFSDSSIAQTATANAGTGTAAMTNQFGANAIVSTANLAGYVTGIQVSYAVPQGTTGPAAAVSNSLSTGDGAFQNFAGLQALNMNTGVAASQNSAVSVSASVGTVNVGP
jgi:hypothetical protein